MNHPGNKRHATARKTHPYSALPDHAYWQRAVAGVAMSEFDPVVSVPFHLSREDKVATAGSCFAQHIARHLQQNGFNYFVTEPPHPILSADIATQFNYGTFTARYGNLYTARQLLQLFQRAYGTFMPRDDAWDEGPGGFVDPFRPRIQPRGFRSRQEFDIQREQHFAAVRRAFEELDVFVFTFGLTETWLSKEDGAVYPLCPGVAGGTFDPARHLFHNFSVEETVADSLAFIDLLRAVNPAARIIITVSPVPLVATCETQNVLLSTTYSKSVLRVACEKLVQAREQVAYFPSYEIITGNYTRGSYFAEDLRSVTEAGVAHVMGIFLRHFARCEVSPGQQLAAPEHVDAHTREMERLVEVNCDEIALGPANNPLP